MGLKPPYSHQPTSPKAISPADSPEDGPADGLRERQFVDELAADGCAREVRKRQLEEEAAAGCVGAVRERQLEDEAAADAFSDCAADDTTTNEFRELGSGGAATAGAVSGCGSDEPAGVGPCDRQFAMPRMSCRLSP